MYRSRNKYKNSKSNQIVAPETEVDLNLNNKPLRRNNSRYFEQLIDEAENDDFVEDEGLENINDIGESEDLTNDFKDVGDNNLESSDEPVVSTGGKSFKMPNIKGAVDKGKRAVDAIKKLKKIPIPTKYKLIIVLVAIILFVCGLLILISLDMFGSGGKTGSSGSSSSSTILSTYSNCDYITVSGQQMDFETYVAGVVTAESGDSRFPEAMKAQAVAARTYALYRTDNCSKSIGNSQNDQVYKEPSEAGIAAAEATKGEVMLDQSGDIVPAYFASFPSGSSFDWSYGSCSSVTCSASTCSSTIYKVPSGDKFTFTMDKYYQGNTWNGAELTNQGGHCYGMSQLGARYLETKGYDYLDILNTFYDFKTSSMDSGNGIVAGDVLGFKIRDSKPNSSNTEWTSENIFYPGNMGHCTWYAHGRALEILKKSLSSSEYKNAKSIASNMRNDAGTWYDANKRLGGKGFAYGNEPKVGSLVVWEAGVNAIKAGECGGYNYPYAGHVGVVEKIIYNSDNTVKSLMVSEGWKSGSGWDGVSFRYSEWSIGTVKSYGGSGGRCRQLAGYVYLLD